MRIKTLLIILSLIILALKVQAQTWWDNAYDFEALDINRITIPINNVGGLDYRYDWSYWEYNSIKRTMVFDQGLWVVGKINGQIHLAHKQWSSSYSPGPIIGNDAAMNIHPEDSLLYRVYKIQGIDTISPGNDYLDWPSDLGAPVNDESNPIIYNDQTVWTLYNGMDSSLSTRKWWNEHSDSLPVFPLEVHSLAYASNETNWIKDMIFFEWRIINKGSETIDSAYLGLWTDIDINDMMQNFSAVDSTIQLGYCWTPVDSGYFIPMSVGYIWKYGPVVYSPGDTAIFDGQKKINYTNLNLTSFHGITDDAAVDPLICPARSTLDAWNIARGFDAEGNIIIDPTTGFPTKFPFSGDPVTNTGFICPAAGGGGAGFVMFSGPINIAPQDTQWVMAMLLISTGNDYRESIVNLRLNAATLQNLSYNQLVSKHSIKSPIVPPKEYFSLSQNYPNPFNSETKIFFNLPYKTKPRIKVFDILGNEIVTLADEVFPAGEYEISFNGKGLPSGVYFYRFEAGDFIQTKKMILLK